MKSGYSTIIVHDSTKQPLFVAGSIAGFTLALLALTGCLAGPDDPEVLDAIEGVDDATNPDEAAASVPAPPAPSRVCYCTCGDPPFRTDHGGAPDANGNCPLDGTVCNPEAVLPEYRRNWLCEIQVVSPLPPDDVANAGSAYVN